MLLDDIYDQLAYGELRRVVVGAGDIDSDDDGISPENFKRLLPLVKLGLTELHKRFLLREQEFKVELIADKVAYSLTYPFAQSNTASVEAKYINDSEETFEDNLMRIERVYGTYQQKEYLLPMNQLTNAEAVRTPRYNSLVIPSDTIAAPWLLETTSLRVVFRADHPAIADLAANTQPGSIPIYLASPYLEPLVYYIASRATTSQGISGEFHDGNNYSMKFEAAVAQLKEANFDLDEDDGHFKLVSRGYP